MKKFSIRRGVVLIEVLYAMALVFTAALIVSATMPLANVSRNKAQLADKAMDLAQKQMEAIRSAGYSNANVTQLASLGLIDSTSAVGTNTYAFSNVDSSKLDNPSKVLPSGSGQIKIEQLSIDLVRLTITVGWSDQGTARSYTVGTLMANL
ncbi:MAG TPA: hypothetical protein VG944_14165 [Fimbriimonas sp.]|nr:hypothetical protein [Fimbriimonas sp.]